MCKTAQLEWHQTFSSGAEQSKVPAVVKCVAGYGTLNVLNGI